MSSQLLKSLCLLLSLSLCFLGASALYGASSPVAKLTKSNFQSDVIKANGFWFVEFYAPWCGHCKSLAPEWEKAAKALNGVVGVGAVDMTTDQDVGSPYGIQGFPTIKFFAGDKSKPIDYNGQRTAEALVDFALNQAQKAVKARLSGKGSSSSSSSSSGSEKAKGGSSEKATDKDVYVLTADNFDELVLNSKDLWMLEFYAPWCGHCQKLEPEYNEAAKKLKGSVKLGKVDCTVEQSLAGKYQIQGYPTLKLYVPGKKDLIPYEGGRDAQAIINYLSQKLEELDIPAEVKQVVSADDFQNSCKSSGICLIAFLPHIYDSSAKERNTYIEALTKTASKFRSKPIKFFWAQGGDHMEVERSLNLEFGYPAVVAISSAKEVYAVSRSGYGEQNLKDFVEGLFIGKEHLTKLPKLTGFKKIAAWDGKDAKPPVEADDSSEPTETSTRADDEL